ncbi:MAG TPA: ABC transporter substrate-binding protein [Propionibacterium sp.]|nr:ABC transporter substrate-binding protein [Propionibacterium sp.]
MNRLTRAALPLVGLAVALTGCSAPAATPAPAGTGSDTASGTVTITHQQGTAEVPRNPAKVVVLDFAALDTLDALDLEDRVVGTAEATLPDSLDEYAGTARVGTAQEPDLEAIAQLDPDAIIISGRSAPKYAELNQVAPTIDLTSDNAKPIESLTTSAQALGDLFDVRAQVDEELAELNATIEDAKKSVPADANALILLTSGGKVSAFGPGARFGGLIHDLLGVPAAAADLEAAQHGQAISFEFIAETNPQTLFVVDRDAAIGQQGAAAEQVLDNPLVARTDAWKNDKVTYLDGADWYLIGFGLDSTERMVEAVKDAVA